MLQTAGAISWDHDLRKMQLHGCRWASELTTTRINSGALPTEPRRPSAAVESLGREFDVPHTTTNRTCVHTETASKICIRNTHPSSVAEFFQDVVLPKSVITHQKKITDSQNTFHNNINTCLLDPPWDETCFEKMYIVLKTWNKVSYYLWIFLKWHAGKKIIENLTCIRTLASGKSNELSPTYKIGHIPNVRWIKVISLIVRKKCRF